MKTPSIFGSWNARGQIGKVVIAQHNKGRQYLRQMFKPKNPRTDRQQEYRQIFSDAVKEYKNLSPDLKEPWQEKAKKEQTTPTALYFKWYRSNFGGLAFCGLARCGWSRLNRGEI